MRFFYLIFFSIFFSLHKAEEVLTNDVPPSEPILNEELLSYVNDEEINKHLENTEENKEIMPGQDFVKEWEEIMGNFVPEDIKSFLIDDGEEEVVIRTKQNKKRPKKSKKKFGNTKNNLKK